MTDAAKAVEASNRICAAWPCPYDPIGDSKYCYEHTSRRTAVEEPAKASRIPEALPVEEPAKGICRKCARENPVWFAPNDVWNAIEQTGILCPICFIAEYEKHAQPTAWKLGPELLAALGDVREGATTSTVQWQGEVKLPEWSPQIQWNTDAADASAVAIMKPTKNGGWVEAFSALRKLDEAGRTEYEFRKLMWLSHSHLGIYGDDGEMQCIECKPYGCVDYKRDPLDVVRNAYQLACRARGEAALTKLRVETSGEKGGE